MRKVQSYSEICRLDLIEVNRASSFSGISPVSMGNGVSPAARLPNPSDARANRVRRSGYYLRTFECTKREHVLKETVATDPMKCPVGLTVISGHHNSRSKSVQNLNPPWTKEDDERLRDFVVRGYSHVRASAALKRSMASTRNQARKIGCPFPPLRIARQKWADTINP
jgi:hypothetical protein